MNDEQKRLLYRKLANATLTYFIAGGHGKAESNRLQANEYRQQLTEAGEDVPTERIVAKFGVFNGVGSV